MRTIVLIWSVLATFGLAAPVLGDATADGRAVSEAFEKALAAGNVPALVALYREDAHVIWPGAGEEASGKAAIEALARRLVSAAKSSPIVLKSQETIPLGDEFMVNIGHWQQAGSTEAGHRTPVDIRTTEVLQKTGGTWLYLVDHASVGAPPPKPATAPHRKSTRR